MKLQWTRVGSSNGETNIELRVPGFAGGPLFAFIKAEELESTIGAEAALEIISTKHYRGVVENAIDLRPME